MRKSERIDLIKRVLDVYLAKPVDGTFLTIESADSPSDYVQFAFHDSGVLHGEVGSREWGDESSPLTATAKKALMRLGFTGGGRNKNYRSEVLTQDADWLAQLVEKAFLAAYGSNRFSDPVFATDHRETQAWLEKVQAWVRVPKTAPNRRLLHVTSDTIRDLLVARGMKVFTDSEGGHMTFWGWEPEYGTEIKLWFRLEADGEIYRIAATSDRPLDPTLRALALRRCNDWNAEHRWPKAYVYTSQDKKRDVLFVELAADMPVGVGASVAMLDDFTGKVVNSTFDFFTWWQSPESGSESSPSVD